ncbi:tenascin-X isoform X17 [Erinaceus europaeus]|uniref:Tenascin-X isoform X17 n=1 Tax=Erinaceus europaeus TaxID=9365 RepID=A0ABM3X9L7_ERIEU|nr:tenascin-X isoform X17 [Erinaceus europaeus]
MMPTPCSLTSSLALLVLLGTVRAGPFSPRFNITRPGPRPPPQPGGHTAEPGVGSPSAQLYEHTVEGGEKQVVFTHRINLPPSAGCGCPPGTEPPAPASEVQSLKVRLEILEELVQGLKEQCTGGCCPVTAKAGTGQTDTRSLCSLHGVFDLSRCACSCEPGWGGPTCSDPTDAPVSPSSSPSCPDDCNDQGRCVRGRCECFPGYTGPSCSWPSCPGDCHGRGRCVQGVCVCRPGFSGADCSLRACPRGCSQKGRCEDGRCVCNPGYTGDDCGVKSCPRDCSQRGRCENGRCVCNPGYTGDDCGARSCPRGCSQKGRCEDGRCVCEPGYTGADCGSRSCPWDCGEGGRCVDGRCVCWPGYAGDDCSRRTCPRDCHGRGRCEDGECLCDAGYSGDDCGVRSCPGDCSQRGRCEDGRCVCWPGYTGPDCGAKSCPRDCRGRGRCEAGVCVCHPGYGGDDCGVRSCPGDCRGRGRCESGRCVCWPGYTGRDCGVRACPGDCRGRGRCVDGRCICNPGFAGDDCGSRRCPGDCRGRGRCEDGVCVCDAGYQGEDCGARSCPGGCRGRGQCLDGRCVCDDGYEGEDCGVRRCPRDCSQRGVCQDGVCACWEGYAGEDCGLRTCPSNCHGRGRCEEGRCVCDSGYTGPTCGVRTCPSDCRGHGRCVQGVCVCHPGYSGPDCGQDEPPASACPGGCGPRELCREGRCVCVEGFRGPDCAIQTCPADCLGRGECLEGSCVCQEGYAGEDCSEEIPAIENMRMHLLEETTVRTEWTRGPGTVDAYEIQFIPMFSLLQTEGMSPPFTARVPSSASAYDQRGLAPGQEYQVTVRALRGTSWGPPASKTITTMIDGPQDLRVVAVTPTTLDLSWLRPQAEVDRFVVSYVSAGNQRVRLEVPPEADRALLTDLMPGVEYVVTVTAERGPAVSYPASIRANTAPGHYSYPEVRPPPPSPQPRPGPQPSPPLLPPRPRRPSRPAEEVGPESRLPPSPPQPPRRPWGNLTAELGRFRGSVQDLERHLRARGYPLRANQTYTAVARHIHEYLLRRQAAPPAPPPRRPHPTASPNAGARKRDSSQGSYDRGTVPRHPKPEVLGFSADGTLLVSLDGLRGHFERMVLRWRPELPADGPGGELTVPGTSRTASLPNLKPSTTYHVEVHGVRAGQTSKSYAFVTTTGSSPTGFLGATDEPPPSGPSTTQGAQAPTLQHRPQELGELRVLGRDMTGRLHVTWTAQPDTFAHFQLTLQVPEGSWVHEELLPGDVHEALVPSPPPGVAYELTLHGVLPSGEPSSPLTYHGIKEKPEKPEKPLTLPRLGELTVTDAASSSLTLHWTVSEGEFDSFVIQYKDRDGPQVVPVEGSQREALITNLELNRKYKFVLYGMVGKKKHGPLVAEAKIVPQSDPISETSPRLGKLWVTDPTPDSLHLSWTVPEGQFDSFLVQYRGKDGQPQVIPVEGPERSATVSQLAPDHKYRFTLFGIANRKRHGPLMAEGTTAPEKKPGHPEPLEQPLLGKLTVNGATPDSLVLSWTVDQGSFDSFMVQYKDAQGQPQAVPVRGHENTVTIRGLESNRKYKMNLYGLHGRHRVGPVSVVASTAPQEVMETPTEPPSTEAPEPPEEPLLGKLTVTGSSQDSLSLSWTVPQGHFDRFLVQYKNGDGQPKVVRVPGTQDWVTISGLEPDHKYKVNLYGFHNGQRVGPISATGVTATEEKTPTETEVTPTEPPSTEAPESPEEPLLGELTVTGSSQDSLSLSWTVPQGHFDRFLVQYKNGDGQPKVVRVPGTQDWVTISGLEPDHKYKVNLYGFHNGQRVGPISATGVTATEEKTPTETEVTPTEPPSTEAPESPEEPLLGELTVTGSSQDSLSLSWTVPQGHFDRFLVQYKNGDGQPKVVRVPGTQDWVTISGLEPDHKYKMNLYGFHNGQRVGPISAFGVTDAVEETPTPTEPPSTEAPEPTVEPLLGELTVTGSSQDSLSLSWTVPQGHFDSFTIQYKDRDGQPQVVRVGGEEREVTVQGLDAGRKYKMHLYGLHGGQRVGPASTVGVTEDEPSPVTTPPLEPRLGQLTVTSVTPSSVGLSWTVPEGKFDSFVVQYKGKDGQPQMVPVSKDQLEVTIPGLEPARKYKMNLYGLQSGQRVGPLSVVAMTAPLPTVPATEPPQEPQLGDLTVTDVTPDSVGLLWTVPGGEFDSFVVQYKDKDGQPQVVPMAADQREATIPGLEPNKKYKFLLFGIKDGKRSSPLSVEAKTVASPGTTPRLGELWVTDPTPDSLHLSWTVPEGHFDSFVVQFKDRDGPRLVPVEGQERSVTITPLDANRKYRFLLYGLLGKKRYGPLTADGTTENRGSQDDTGIKRLPKPRLGEELQVTSVTPDSVDLSWTVTEGHFDSFVVQYKDKDGQPQVVPVEGSLREVRVPDLDPGRRYKLLLYGLHQGKRVGPLSTTAVTGHREDIGTTTLTSNTPAPEVFLGELTVVEATPHTLHLSWIETEGEFDSFEVQFIDQTGKQEVLTVGGDQKDITLYDLESDHRYLVNLYGFHGQQRVGPAQVEALTVLREEEDEPSEPPTISSEPPFKPLLGELTVTGSSQDSLSLSWTIPEGHFDSFVIQYKNGDEQPKIVQVPGHQNWVTISGLEPDHKYKVNLYGFYSDQRVGPISAVGVTDAVEETPIPTEPPSTEAPEPPEEPLLGELTVSGSSQDSLSLSWTVPQGHFDSFTIQYKDKDGQPQVVRVRGEEREVTVRGLDAGRKYKMHLYGLHGGQRVGPVSTVGVTEPEGEPTSPPVKPLLGELTVTGSSQDSLSLSWTVPQGQFDHFLVQYKNGDGQPKVLRVPGTQDWVTISGLEPDHKYKMNLYGFHGDQREGPISTVGVTGKDEEMTPFPTDGPTTTPEPPFKPHLGELTVTGSSQDSLSLSWTVPQGHFDRFLVQYKNGDGQPKVVRVPGTQDWVTISGLEPDHKYKVNLYGFHNGQRVGPISAIGVTDAVEETPTLTEPLSTEAPEPSEEPLLGELTVTGSSQDSLSLSWTVPQGQFDRFLVQYKNGDGQPKVVRVPGTQDWVTISGLEPDHKYKVNLYGFHNGQRVGPISATGVTATEEKTPTETEVTPTEPPSTEAPESPEEPLLGELTVTGSSQDSLSLSWTVPQGHFDRFLVQYKNGDGQPKVVRVPGTQDWVTISGLEPDHKYKVNLYGFHNGQRVGPISAFGVTDAVEETPTPTEPPSTEAPDPPVEPLLGELTVTGSSQDSLSLSWTVPQGHFDSFTIQYKDRDGQPQVVRVGGEEREVTVRGLDAGRKYKMHLYGLHGGQRVGPVSTVGVTASLPTEPPVALSLGELTVVSVASDTVHLSWTVAQGPFDSFLVQYKDSQGQPQAVPVDGSLREVIVSGLDPARKYKFLLFGLQDEKKHGPVSTEAKTLPDKKPSPRLGDLTVTDVTPDSVGLLWTVPEGEFDSFVVQYKDKDRQPQVVPVAADQRKVTIPGLEPKKKYKFLLYGLAGRKRLGPVSAEGTTAPLEKELPPLPRLGELTLTDETPDSIHLSWTVAQGPFDSFVVQYRGTDGQPRAVPVAADEREVTIEGLEAGKKYKFLLFGLFRGQRLGPISGLGATASAEDTPIPGIPATEAPEGPRLGVLTVNSVAPDALRLSWSVAQGVFESFVIQYRDTDGKSQALLVDGDQSTVLVSSLEPSTPYMFSLYGLHGGKRLGPISAEGITGPAPPAGEIPGEPRPRLSQLSVTDVTTSSLRLNWEAPPGAFDSFLLRFGVPSQSSLEPYPRPLLQRELTVPGSRRSAAIRDLRPGTLYNLTLYGLRGPHKADSIQGSARTLSPVLESPHDLQFSEIGETSAKVSWTPPPSRVDSFKVSYQLADGGEPQSVRVDSRAQTQTLKGLAPGTRYEVTVVSIRGFEESEPLTGFFTTVSDGPTKLQALNLTEGSTVLHWDPPQNPVDTYDVQVTAPEAPSLQASAPGSAVDYPLSGLELHTNYTAMVRGLRGSNFTSPANITFTTGLEAPRDLEAKEVTPRTALLTWTEPPDPPTGYLLSFNTPGEQTQEILLPGGVTSHRLLGLFPSTTYNAFLRAVWGESFSPPMPTSFTTGGLRIPFPRDCGEEMQNGISTSRTTTIFLNGNRERPLDVFCDMETDGGGWLVFQRRMDGKTDFWRDWEDYAHGFGNISREFWLGNEALHSLTSSGDYSLRVDLRAGDEAVFAHYDSFRVDSAAKYYQLHLEGYHGTAGDSMTYHSGSVFSARDRDPNNLLISCAVSYRGAWWYRNCHYANLNGLYGSTVDHQGVSWYYWKGFGFSVPFTEMKLRPRNYHPPAWGG